MLREKTAPLLGLLLFLLLHFLLAHLRLNLTDSSSPAGLYWLSSEPPGAGEMAAVCLPEALARAGRERGYLAAGPCPGGAAAVGKWIVAAGGDEVEVADGGLRVNGRPLAGTRRLRRDRLGRELEALPAGSYRTPPGHVWLVSTHSPRSWDSRYYGAVPLPPEARALARLELP